MERELQTLDKCAFSHLVGLGAAAGDSRSGQPGFSVSGLRGPKRPWSMRPVSGAIYILGTTEIKHETLVSRVDIKPH